MNTLILALLNRGLVTSLLILAVLLLRPLLKPKWLRCLFWAAAALGQMFPHGRWIQSCPELLGPIWLLGLLVLAVVGVTALWVLGRRLTRAQLVQNRVYVCDSLRQSLLWGLWRPKIYLPNGLLFWEQDYVLLHQKTRIRALTPLWSSLSLVLVAVYWWNPVIWAGCILFRKDLDMACWEAATAAMGENSRKAFHQALSSSVQWHLPWPSRRELMQKLRAMRIQNPKARLAVNLVLAAALVTGGFLLGKTLLPNEGKPGDTEAILELKDKYPDLFRVDASEGLMIYVGELAPESYRFTLEAWFPDSGLAYEPGSQSSLVDAREMKAILSYYDLPPERIQIRYYYIPFSSYIGNSSQSRLEHIRNELLGIQLDVSSLKEKYPELFELDNSWYLTVFVAQGKGQDYRFALTSDNPFSSIAVPKPDENSSWTTMEEMRIILEFYAMPAERVVLIPYDVGTLSDAQLHILREYLLGLRDEPVIPTPLPGGLYQKYPQLFDLDTTGDGITVYVCQVEELGYRCTLLPSGVRPEDAARELPNQPLTTLEEMAQILKSYTLNPRNVTVKSFQAPAFDYTDTMTYSQMISVRERLFGTDLDETELGLLWQLYPDYFAQDQEGAVDVYVWQTQSGDHQCALLPGNQNLDVDGWEMNMHGVPLGAMRQILTSYSLPVENIRVIPVLFTANNLYPLQEAQYAYTLKAQLLSDYVSKALEPPVVSLEKEKLYARYRGYYHHGSSDLVIYTWENDRGQWFTLLPVQKPGPGVKDFLKYPSATLEEMQWILFYAGYDAEQISIRWIEFQQSGCFFLTTSTAELKEKLTAWLN